MKYAAWFIGGALVGAFLFYWITLWIVKRYLRW